MEYLLDVVGLSRAALTRELAASPVGQDLVEAGRIGALGAIIASMQPKIDTTKMFGLDKLDFDKLTNVHALIANMSQTTPALSQWMQEISQQLATSPGTKALAEAAESSSMHALIANMSLTTPALSQWMQEISQQLATSPGTKALAEAAASPSMHAIRLAAEAQRAQTTKDAG